MYIYINVYKYQDPTMWLDNGRQLEEVLTQQNAVKVEYGPSPDLRYDEYVLTVVAVCCSVLQCSAVFVYGGSLDTANCI